MKRFILVFLAVLILCGCTAQTPSPTVENTPTASQTVTPTVTPTQTVENSPSPTKTPTPKPTGTPSGFNAHTEFKNGSGDLELEYSIYVPDDYDQSKEYPLVVYFSSESQSAGDDYGVMEDVNLLFCHKESPLHDSIVITPYKGSQWVHADAKRVKDVIEYVSSKYNVDAQRKYMIATRLGCWMAWQTVLQYPQCASAFVSVYGVGVTVYGDSFGNVDAIIDDIRPEMKDMPIHYVHDIGGDPEANMREYGEIAYNALKDLGGFTNVYLTQTDDKNGADVANNYVSVDDISILEWLYQQQRQTVIYGE